LFVISLVDLGKPSRVMLLFIANRVRNERTVGRRAPTTVKKVERNLSARCGDRVTDNRRLVSFAFLRHFIIFDKK
jgi:hypothetical protein